MKISLQGRTALITGGSMGLGLAMATKFADAGADVAIVARRPAVLDDASRVVSARASGKVAAFTCDVSQADAIGPLFDEVMSTMGKVDILVNNAGAPRRAPFEEISDDVWRADFDLKFFAAIRLTRLVLPQMKERRWGRILNILNTASKAPPALSAPTSVTRAAGLALTKVLAGEFASYNVLVNALLVGEIVSDQTVRSHVQSGKELSLDEYILLKGASIPIGRMGVADELANVACFMASDAASYLTGTAINVDGGASPIV